MSILHKIIFNKNIDHSILIEYIQKNEFIKLELRRDETLYFWWDNESTKGFDITFNDDYIEIRNTVLSNEFDFDLTNLIVSKIIEITNGVIFDETNKPVALPIFNKETIKKIELNDAKTISLFSEKETFTIFGPIRKIHFGKRLHQKFKNLSNEALKNSYHQLIKTINFDYSKYEYGIFISLNEDEKRLKLLTNNTNVLIDQYDFIGFLLNNEEQVVITHDDLISILPVSWKLLDEYTIVAPILSEKEWRELLVNAKQLDISDTLMDL